MRVTVISPEIHTYGAMLIGGVLRDAGYEVDLKTELAAREATPVLLSLYSTQHLISPAIRHFVAAHRAAGGAVYVGGPVSAAPEIVLGELSPDAVCVGEGEETVLRLLEEGPHEGISGCAWTDKGAMRFTGPAPPAPMHRPLPLIPPDIGSQDIRGASAYIETHRGCIGACTFCQVPRFFGRSVRSRDLGDVLAEVQAFKDAGAKRLSVSGGTGSLYCCSPDGAVNDEVFAALLEGMAAIMGPKNISSPDIRVDCISDTVLDAIRDYTIGWVFFGLESGSNRVLRLMGKGVTAEVAARGVEACREHGLKVAGSFIVGYPTETEEEYEETRDFIAMNSLDDVFVSIAEPIPSTPLADLVLRTPREENPVYMPHTGEYSSLHLTEAEARSFDLQQHADLFKPGLHVVTDEVFSAYLAGVRKDGEDVRRVTELLFSYYGGR
ncbi:MAG TPA: TIGR04014 family B12-binding domain/radical SAM domain-containing protein [Methanoculleus sp.]|nr:TIGR04014 family B12-binding domain/radical SAM domain-containing protein [Methanoculleus sp.]